MAEYVDLIVRVNSAAEKITPDSGFQEDVGALSELHSVLVEAGGSLDSAWRASLMAHARDQLDSITALVDVKYLTQPAERLELTQSIAATRAFIESGGDPVCFTQGTCIDTSRGPVPIEQLTAGAQVMTPRGVCAVKWIGRRNLKALQRLPENARRTHYPVHIAAGALGGGLPTQRLSVSPGHHLYIDGVLIRALDLINGVSIFQDPVVDSVQYLHIELETFDVIRAHGVYSESWADGGNRSFFDNADVVCLRPQDLKRRRASRPGFEVVRPTGKGSEKLRAIQRRLAELAGTLDTALPIAASTESIETPMGSPAMTGELAAA
ncbi:Hint domain-containing protein [Bordetella sp. 15P40C-2]|uniref:Hint domain-containing protein n=1 Tax=Bordetella sp. 15P40C-2 TaxID=2572246 RepID=UPI0013653B7B|nr:Hint domain-containing protein [Bordetella sp. 15P40C-2]